MFFRGFRETYGISLTRFLLAFWTIFEKVFRTGTQKCHGTPFRTQNHLGTNNTIFELENRDENENLQIQNDQQIEIY